MRKSGKIMWDFMPGTIVGLVAAMVLCVGESGATTTSTPGFNVLLDAYSCEVVSCTGITNFTSTSTTVTGCDSNGVDVCIKARTSMTATSTYHKIRTCTCEGVAIGSAQFTSGTSTYKCPDSSGISPNVCTCAGAGGECETDADCSTDWGNMQGTLSVPNGYQFRGEGSCLKNCSCYDYNGEGPIMQIPVYRCADTYYGTADCILQANTEVVDGISRPAGIYCSGCTECPNNGTCTAGNGTKPSCNAGYYRYDINNDDGSTSCSCWRCPRITDSATGRQIYTNSGLSTTAYGTSSAGSTSISKCYWGAGTYYDAVGTIKINSGTSYTTCGYSD